MSWRKGYSGEYRAKSELIERFGKECVLKIAISQIGADYMVIKEGILIMIVEVKETNQFERIKAFAEINDCLAELWIYYRKGIGKEIEKERVILNVVSGLENH